MEEENKKRESVVSRLIFVFAMVLVFIAICLTLFRYQLAGKAFMKKDYVVSLALTSPELGSIVGSMI